MKSYTVHGHRAKNNGRSYTRLDNAYRGIKREKLRQLDEHGIVITAAFWIIPNVDGIEQQHREGG